MIQTNNDGSTSSQTKENRVGQDVKAVAAGVATASGVVHSPIAIQNLHLRPPGGNKSSNTAVKRREGYNAFRSLVEQLILEVRGLSNFMANGLVAVEGLEAVIEIEFLLERLYDCKWGEGESLKRIAVMMKSQLSNAVWTEMHVKFLTEVLLQLRSRYLINDSVVNDCFELITEMGLAQFRGTTTETAVRKKYKIVEAD